MAVWDNNARSGHLSLETLNAALAGAKVQLRTARNRWLKVKGPAGAFLLTGLIIGYFSPGRTMVEPAIAAAGMILAHGGFVALYFDPAPAAGSLMLAFAGGTLLALLGGWVGESLQTAVRSR